jgi:hypothetical protein
MLDRLRRAAKPPVDLSILAGRVDPYQRAGLDRDPAAGDVQPRQDPGRRQPGRPDGGSEQRDATVAGLPTTVKRMPPVGSLANGDVALLIVLARVLPLGQVHLDPSGRQLLAQSPGQLVAQVVVM